MAKTGPIPGPSLQRVRPRPSILRRLHDQVMREEREVSGSVGGETDGQVRGGEVPRGGNQLRWIRGLSFGQRVGGREGAESGDC